jgi:hypothetical protein
MMDTTLGKIIHESKTRTIPIMPQPRENKGNGFDLCLGRHLLGFRELDWGTNFNMFISSY